METELQFKYLVLTKVSNDNENSKNNPTSRLGYSDIRGYCKDKPEIGKQLMLYHNTGSNNPITWTSKIENIDYEKQRIKTKNSTYSYEIITSL